MSHESQARAKIHSIPARPFHFHWIIKNFLGQQPKGAAWREEQDGPREGLSPQRQLPAPPRLPSNRELSPPRRVKPSLRSCEDSPGAAVEGWGRSAPTLVPERPYAATSAPPVARSNRQWVWLSPAESRMRGARSSKGSLLCSASRLRLPGPVICNLKSRGQGQ